MRWQLFTLSLVFLVTTGTGCRQAKPEDKALVSATPPSSPPVERSIDWLENGQKLLICFYDLTSGPPKLTLERTIHRDGTITLLSNEVFVAADKSRRELQGEVQAHYVSEGIAHQVMILVGGVDLYFVNGEVKEPGMKVLAPPVPTLLETIDLAGGFTTSADRKHVEVQHRNGDVEIYNYNNLMRAGTNLPAISPGDRVKVSKRKFLW